MDTPIKKRMQKYVADAIGKATGEVVAKEAGKAVAKAAEKKSEQKTSTPAAAPKEPKIVKITKNLEGERKEYEPMEKKPMEKKPMKENSIEDPEILLRNLTSSMQQSAQEKSQISKAARENVMKQMGTLDLPTIQSKEEKTSAIKEKLKKLVKKKEEE
jgi:hypothetical protein